jgi:hypothetical protein
MSTQAAGSANGAAPAMLVISCSDARFARENVQPSWKRRLNFAGDIFEFRCPGGGIALADRGSSFYQSAFDSFRLLSGSRRITDIVLAFHEDCAYFSDKYGSAGSFPGDVEGRKWGLADEAVRNVIGWSETLHVRPLYTRFVANRAVDEFIRHHHAHRADGRAHAGHHHAHCHEPRATTPMRRDLILAPSERATLRSFDRQVEERLLRTNENIDDVIAAAEAQARATGTVPAWRIEMRAREFIDLLRGSGRKDMRKVVQTFVQAYAGQSIPRGVLRAVMSELEDYMQKDLGQGSAKSHS